MLTQLSARHLGSVQPRSKSGHPSRSLSMAQWCPSPAHPTLHLHLNREMIQIKLASMRFMALLPESVPPSMLACCVSITNCSIWTHSRYLSTSYCTVSRKPPWTCALVRSVGVHAVRIRTTSSDAFATFVNIVATLALECVINSRRHVKPLGVVAVVARRASFTTESRRQVGAADALIARLNQVAL